MTTINLRDFYPWYTQNEFVEVPDEIAEELLANKRYEKSCRRRIYRNKAHYSIDADDGIENCAAFTVMTPHEVMEYKQMFCRLCRALNSLPEAQARRIEAHYMKRISQRDMAKFEHVNERNIRHSIRKGLAGMKKYLETF